MAIDRNKYDPFKEWEKAMDRLTEERVAAEIAMTAFSDEIKKEMSEPKARSLKSAATNLTRNPDYYRELARIGHQRRRERKLQNA